MGLFLHKGMAIPKVKIKVKVGCLLNNTWYNPGDYCEVPADVAKRKVEEKGAEYYIPPPPKPVESAALDPATEKATLPKAEKKATGGNR